MKRLSIFLFLSAIATVTVEFAGFGVFEDNRIYWDRFEAIRRSQWRIGGRLDPIAIHDEIVEEYGPGAGAPTGLWHGSLGIPRVFLSFAATIANNSFRADIYTSPDPVFAKHNRGDAYIVGFAIGVILFIVLFAVLMPNPRRPLDE